MFVTKNNEKFMVCPFDKNHQVLPLRFENHVRKCCLKFNIVPDICPFNAKHYVEKGEIRHHMEVCPDRGRLEKELYQKADKYSSTLELNPMFSSTANLVNNEKMMSKHDECWDTEANLSTSTKVRTFPDRSLYTNRTKSERKRLREEALLHFKEKKEQEKDALEETIMSQSQIMTSIEERLESTKIEELIEDESVNDTESIITSGTRSYRESSLASAMSRGRGRGLSTRTTCYSIKSTITDLDDNKSIISSSQFDDQ